MDIVCYDRTLTMTPDSSVMSRRYR